MSAAPLISLENITVRLSDQWLLGGTSWCIRTGENWAVLGPNGSGKSTLVKTLMGKVPVVRGRIVHHRHSEEEKYRPPRYISLFSGEQHELLIARERLLDTFRDFSGRIDEVTTVTEFLTHTAAGNAAPTRRTADRVAGLLVQLGIDALAERGVTTLSAGELRKVLLAKALARPADLLILDEPFDGLDHRAAGELRSRIQDLAAEGVQMILITHRLAEIFPAVTHVLYLQDGAIRFKGPRTQVLERLKALARQAAADLAAPEATPRAPRESALPPRRVSPNTTPLVEMKQVTVAYGGRNIIDRLDWTVRAGENWVLHGPNASGKTTLINLIVGDNPQAYANDVRLFGRRKGSGETIWDIRRRLGVVSTELHATYNLPIKALDVTCSGFFDSVGLYRRCSPQQVATATDWLRRLRAGHLADKPFTHLSYGQKQLVLLARAMVKAPELLIMDDPCIGLDVVNRHRLLDALDHIGRQTATSLIMTTYHEREILPCTTHVLRLGNGAVRCERRPAPDDPAPLCA